MYKRSTNSQSNAIYTSKSSVYICKMLTKLYSKLYLAVKMNQLHGVYKDLLKTSYIVATI